MNGGGEKNIDPGFKVMKERDQSQRAGLRAVARQDDRAVPVGPGRDRGVGHRPRAGLRQHRLPGRFRLSRRKARRSCSPRPARSPRPRSIPLAHEFIKMLISSRSPDRAWRRRWATARSTPRSTSPCRSWARWRRSASARQALSIPTGTPSTTSARNGPSAGTARSSADLIGRSGDSCDGLSRARSGRQDGSARNGGRRLQSRGRQGGVHLVARPVGLRQDHDPADDRGLPRAHARRDQPGGQRPAGGAAGQARARHRVPELRAVSAHDGGRERRLRPRDAGCRAAERASACARDARAGRPRRLTRTVIRAACPAASSSAWRWPVRW